MLGEKGFFFFSLIKKINKSFGQEVISENDGHY
jgi:hypothetical protein